MFLCRLNPDGTFDSTFGGGNQVVFVNFGINNFPIPGGMALQSEGKIVAANGTNSDFALAKFNPTNGSLDATFGVNGKVVTAVGSGEDRTHSIKIEAKGKIVTAGQTYV
jgi:uncharacterized delta-60 repeat protein